TRGAQGYAAGKAVHRIDRDGACPLTPLGNGYSGRRRGQTEVRRTRTTGEGERSDVRAPVEDSVGFLVLVHVPEGTVIGRVNYHSGIVAPTVARVRGGSLRASAGHEGGFALHGAQRIAGHSAGKANTRMDGAAGRAVSQPDIATLILGHACHPAIGGIRGKSSLLIERDGAGRVIEFIPADRHLAGVSDSVVDHRPIVIGEVPDGKAVHQPVAKSVQGLRCSQLWDASAAIAAGKVGVRHVYGGRRRKSGRARCEVQGKLAKVQLARIVVLPAYEKPRRAIRGRRGAVVIGRKVSEFATGSHLAELGCGRVACQHFGTVESAEVGADEGLPILKNVVGSEVSAVAGGGP